MTGEELCLRPQVELEVDVRGVVDTVEAGIVDMRAASFGTGAPRSLAVMRSALAAVDDLVLRRSTRTDCTRWLVLALGLGGLHLAAHNETVEIRSQNCSHPVVGSL